jgi:hypothetical protein
MTHVMDKTDALLLSEKSRQPDITEAAKVKPMPKREIEADGFCTVFPPLDLGDAKAA